MQTITTLTIDKPSPISCQYLIGCQVKNATPEIPKSTNDCRWILEPKQNRNHVKHACLIPYIYIFLIFFRISLKIVYMIWNYDNYTYELCLIWISICNSFSQFPRSTIDQNWLDMWRIWSSGRIMKILTKTNRLSSRINSETRQFTWQHMLQIRDDFELEHICFPIKFLHTELCSSNQCQLFHDYISGKNESGGDGTVLVTIDNRPYIILCWHKQTVTLEKRYVNIPLHEQNTPTTLTVTMVNELPYVYTRYKHNRYK